MSMLAGSLENGNNTSPPSSLEDITPLVEEAVGSSSQERLGTTRFNSNFQAVRVRPVGTAQRMTREQRLQDILTAVLEERVNRGKNYYFMRYVCETMKDMSDEDEADDLRYQVHKALNEAKVRRRNRKMKQQQQQQQAQLQNNSSSQ